MPVPAPPPSPSPTPAIIQTVRVATGSPQSLHKLPFAASVLGAAQIARSAASTSDGLLSRLPGVDRERSNSAFTNYGQLRVSFAGAGTDRGLVLADGIPAQDGFGGQVDWPAYPVSDLERVELLRGPGSALYGSGAIGGVLVLVPAFSRNAGCLGTASNGGSTICANAATPIDATATASVALSHTSAVDAPARESATMARFRFAKRLGETELAYTYRGAWDSQQEGRPNYDFARALGQHVVSLQRDSARASLSGAIFARDVRLTNRADAFPASPGTLLYTQQVPSHETGANAQWAIGQHSRFTLRADARFISGVSDQYDASNVLTVAGSGVQYAGGIAAQQSIAFSRGEVIGGVRADVVSIEQGTILAKGSISSLRPRTDRALSPRLALRYDLSKHVAFRAAAGSGLRAPYLNELLRGFVIGTISYKSNPNLIPERSSSLTGGFDVLNDRSEVALDLNRTFVSDAIGFITAAPLVQIRSNVARTLTDGVTATWRSEASRCSSISFSASTQNARVVSGPAADIGKQLPFVPKASVRGSYDGRVGQVEAGVSVSYLGQTYADDVNAQPLGVALVSGVHAAVPLRERLALTIDASNITDAHYLSSSDRYAPPRVVSIGLRFGEPGDYAREGCHS